MTKNKELIIDFLDELQNFLDSNLIEDVNRILDKFYAEQFINKLIEWEYNKENIRALTPLIIFRFLTDYKKEIWNVINYFGISKDDEKYFLYKNQKITLDQNTLKNILESLNNIENRGLFTKFISIDNQKEILSNELLTIDTELDSNTFDELFDKTSFVFKNTPQGLKEIKKYLGYIDRIVDKDSLFKQMFETETEDNIINYIINSNVLNNIMSSLSSDYKFYISNFLEDKNHVFTKRISEIIGSDDEKIDNTKGIVEFFLKIMNLFPEMIFDVLRMLDDIWEKSEFEKEDDEEYDVISNNTEAIKESLNKLDIKTRINKMYEIYKNFHYLVIWDAFISIKDNDLDKIDESYYSFIRNISEDGDNWIILDKILSFRGFVRPLAYDGMKYYENASFDNIVNYKIKIDEKFDGNHYKDIFSGHRQKGKWFDIYKEDKRKIINEYLNSIFKKTHNFEFYPIYNSDDVMKKKFTNTIVEFSLSECKKINVLSPKIKSILTRYVRDFEEEINKITKLDIPNWNYNNETLKELTDTHDQMKSHIKKEKENLIDWSKTFNKFDKRKNPTYKEILSFSEEKKKEVEKFKNKFEKQKQEFNNVLKGFEDYKSNYKINEFSPKDSKLKNESLIIDNNHEIYLAKIFIKNKK